MGNFKGRGRGGRDRERGGNRGGGGFRNRDERPEMHEAICSECGRDCEVPFRPSGDKPVYCSECFKNRDKGESRNESRRPSFEDKKMFSAVCDKCGRDCEVPFRPTGDKPVYCSECFGKGDNKFSKNPEQPNKQLEMINSKLDKILSMLVTVGSKDEPKKTEAKKSENPKAKKVKKSAIKAKTASKTVKPKKKK